MNANDLLNWLQKNKTVFPYTKNIKTSFNLGELVPYNTEEALPGDNWNFGIDSLIRVTGTFVKAPMENLYIEIKHFAVPYRLLWDNFKRLMGERDDYDTVDDSEIKIPLIKFTDKTTAAKVWNYSKSIMAYLGIPVPSASDKTNNLELPEITKLIINAYALIWNNFYRDQNTQQAKKVDTTDADIHFIDQSLPAADWHNSAPDEYTGKLAKVNKYLDYFTNTFLDTQKGNAVTISLGGTAPVITGGSLPHITVINPMHIRGITNGDFLIDSGIGIGAKGGGPASYGVSSNSFPGTPIEGIYPSNLHADLSQSTPISINDLREATKLQQMKEIDLVAGTRYFEIVESYFGVYNALAELDYPELIGSSTQELMLSQVVQTSTAVSPDTTQPGNIAGYLVQGALMSGVNKQIKEHSVIMSCLTIKQKHTYQQGVDKKFLRRTKLDIFNPTMIGLGFQPIYTKEIYGHQTPANQNNIFGYAPAWERYRKPTDLITGQLNINSQDSAGNSNSLAIWHFGDSYGTAPVLNPQWKLETTENLDRTLSVTSALADQFIIDITHRGTKISTVDPLGKPMI